MRIIIIIIIRLFLRDKSIVNYILWYYMLCAVQAKVKCKRKQKSKAAVQFGGLVHQLYRPSTAREAELDVFPLEFSAVTM